MRPLLNKAMHSDGVRAALILFALLNACFFSSLWGNATLLNSARDVATITPKGAWAGLPAPTVVGRTLDSGAPAWQTEPWLSLEHHDLRTKALPLWNPYQGYGEPLAANMQSQPYYPLALLLASYLTPRTYSWYILLRLYIAGLCAYFYLRLFVSFVPALAGGAASLLAGYYLLLLTMPHLSVETLIPAALLTAEHLLRKPRCSTLVSFAGVTMCVLFGGMPESALLLFTFVSLYFVWRLLTDADVGQHFWQAAWRFGLGLGAGAGLAAFLLLPFLEYVKLSFNTHQAGAGPISGLAYDPVKISALSYFFPLIFGHAGGGIVAPSGNGARNYVGLLAIFPASLAVYIIFRKTADPGVQKLRRLAIFFASTVFLIVLKRYGVTIINELGRLPYFRQTLLVKYEESLLSIALACLCAIGVHLIWTNQISTRVQARALIFTALLLATPLFAARTIYFEITQAAVFPEVILWALGVPILLLLVLGVSFFFLKERPAAFSFCVVACIALDLSLNYIVPMYYVFGDLPVRSANPYVGAPFVNFLRRNTTDKERIFGRDGVLYPNWASAFQLSDIRDLDAMYYHKYFPFARNFIRDIYRPGESELFDRWTGGAKFTFSDPLARRLLTLSSVRYLISPDFEGSPFDPSFRQVYFQEAHIFENPAVLPRAAVYYSVSFAPNSSGVLSTLADPMLDLFQKAVLDSSQLTPAESAKLNPLAQNSPTRVDAGSITSYKPQEVEITANPSRPGILVLNDSDYPGWKAEVDGHPQDWFSVNYMFRGVYLEPGAHKVRFVYRPESFELGVKISLATIAFLAILGIIDRRRPVRS